MPTESHQPPLRFIFIAPNPDYDFYLPIKKGMADASALLAVESVFAGTRGVDVQAQVQMVREALKNGYDGIALSIIDPEAFKGVVQDAIDMGVPVVAFNVDANRKQNARLAAVCQNLYEAGRRLGLEAASFIAQKGRVLATMHDCGVSALEDRLQGVREALGSRDVTWKILITGTERIEAMNRIREALASDDRIKTVISTGMIDTEASGLVIETHFRDDGYAAAGFDLSPEILRLIKAGIIRFTIDQQPYIQGFYPVVQLTLYHRYGIKPSDIDTGATLITAESADAVLRLTESHHR